MLKGILFCAFANFLFGIGYYFAILLRPLSGESIFAFRILVLIPFILLAIFLFKQQHKFIELGQKIKQNPKLILLILFLALNSGIQIWLFLWAPNNGQAIAVSVGYLLLPIVAVMIGKIVFKEYFSPLKWLSVGFAAVGVVSNLYFAGAISWATILAAVGYPMYVALRRYFGINNLATFFIELMLIMPVAAYLVSQINLEPILLENKNLFYFIGLMGLVSGLAFMLYILASDMIPVNVLGLIGYVEPLMMLIVSFLIGETLDSKSYFLMVCLFIAISLLTLDNFKRTKRKKVYSI